MSSPSFILMRFAAPRGYLRKTRLTIRKQKSPASGEKWQYFGSLYIDNVLRKHETSSQRDAFWEWSPEEFVVKPPRLLQTSSTVPMVSVSQRQYQETNEASDRLLKENRTLRTTIDRTAQQIKKATDALKRYEKLEETNMGLLKENQKMQNEIQEWKEYVCGLKQDSKADQTRINDLEEKLVLVQNSKPSSRRTANTQTTPIQNSQELPRTVTVGLPRQLTKSEDIDVDDAENSGYNDIGEAGTGPPREPPTVVDCSVINSLPKGSRKALDAKLAASCSAST